MFKKIFATALVAMFLSLSALASDDPFSQAVLSHQARKDNEVLKKTVPRVLVGTGAGGAAGYGIARMLGASVPKAKGATAIGAVIGAIGGLIWDRRANRNNDAADGKQAGMLQDRGGQSDLTQLESEYEAKFTAQQTSFNARFSDLEKRFTERAAVSTTRNGDNVVVNAGIGASQPPAMITVENCLPAQFAKTQVYDDFVGAWRRLANREKRAIATTDPEAAPKVRTWGNLPGGGGEGWIELKVGDGLARISTGWWRIQ